MAAAPSTPWTDARPAANGLAVSQNFANWFARSKLVDWDGLPRQFFHGTTREFEAFEPDRCRVIRQTGAEPRSIFFSSRPDVAASYAGQRTPGSPTRLPNEQLYEQWLELLKRHGPVGPARDFMRQHEVPDPPSHTEGGQVIPVFISAQKVLKVNARQGHWNEIRWKSDDWDTNHLIAHARELGYHAVLIRNVHDRAEGKGAAGDVCAVFEGWRIKSALGNSGLYLRSSPSLADVQASLELQRAHRAAAAVRQATRPRRRAGSAIAA